MIEDQFEKGVSAFWNTLGNCDNPHPVNTRAASDWAYGFEYARLEALYMEALEHDAREIGSA